MNEYRLEQLFDLQMGKTPSRNESSYWLNGLHDWISIRDLSNSSKYISETNEKLSDIAVKESGIRIIPKDTVIMSFKLSIGKVAITSHDMYSNEAIMAFHDKKVVEILPEYLYYLLLGKNWDEGSNKAVMGITLNKATLSMIKIRMHDIVNQAQITSILDNLDKQINNKKKQLTEYDQLIKSRFIEMFEGKYKKIKVSEKLKTTSGGTPISSKREYYDNGTIPWLTSGEVNQGRIFTTEKYITELGLASSSAKWIPNKSIVIAMYGATAGKVGIIEIPLTTNQAVCSVLPNKDFEPEYLRFAFEHISEELASKAVGGGQPNISQTIIKESYIYNPPFKVQQEFASFVKQVDKLKFVVQKSLDETQKLFDSLMQEYFG